MLTRIAKNGDSLSYASLIEKCLRTADPKLCRLLHAKLVKTALNLDIFHANRLVDVYAKCDSLADSRKVFNAIALKNVYSWNTILAACSKTGLVGEARQLFDEMPQRNLVTWNSMISALAQHGQQLEAIDLFCRMQKENRWPVIDNFTFASIINICGSLSALELARQVHGMAIVIGLELNLVAQNALVDAYGKCSDVNSLCQLFDRMSERNVVSWTSAVVGYAQSNRLDRAYQTFEAMPFKNSVSWTALITGYTQNGHGDKALDLFARMQKARIPPTAPTFVSILSACSSSVLIEHGKQIHGHIARSTMDINNIFINNALIDMYAKCGDMNSASYLFDEMPQRDVISWNSLVTGFAQNGHGRQTLIVFEKMINSGIKPNYITFLGVLSACNHSGLVSEGRWYLESMERDHGVHLRPEHYSIMVDALGRKNCLEEAIDLINNASCGPDAGMWGALLGACRIHGNLDLATRAAKSLFNLEPVNASRYVMLSNIYASVGRWDDVDRMRGLMKERGVRKEAACSWIVVRNVRHGFVAGDKSHDQAPQIYDTLVNLVDHIKESGYLPNYFERGMCLSDKCRWLW